MLCELQCFLIKHLLYVSPCCVLRLPMDVGQPDMLAASQDRGGGWSQLSWTILPDNQWRRLWSVHSVGFICVMCPTDWEAHPWCFCQVCCWWLVVLKWDLLRSTVRKLWEMQGRDDCLLSRWRPMKINALRPILIPVILTMFINDLQKRILQLWNSLE